MKKAGLLLLFIGLMMSSNFAFGDLTVDEVASDEKSFFEEEGAKGFIQEDNILTIYVGIDGMVEINIKENPTTGFTWHMNVDYPEMIEFEVDEFASPNLQRESDEQIVGASGMHTYVFRTKKQGMVKISLDYYRDWEPDIVADSRVYMLNIVPDGEKAVYVNEFKAYEGNETNQPEILILNDSQEATAFIVGDDDIDSKESVKAEVVEKKFNIFQRFFLWLKNLFS